MVTKLCKSNLFLYLYMTFFTCNVLADNNWPVPYKRYTLRPKSDPYCQAGVITFCPTGYPDNVMPQFEDDDEIEIYALKKPVWEFKFGDLLGKFHIMHDALGFRDVKTGLNYTMEWYELFQLMNCTFAHVRNDTIQWCNQGAVCIYPGIEDKLWIENGTLVKIATVSGKIFNKFSDWVMWDNRTGLFYETWTVKEKASPDGKTWFDPFDCASWVIRALAEFGLLGAKFNQSVHLNYTKINLYSEEPIYLGSTDEIFNIQANDSMKTIAKNIYNFYKKFQSQKTSIALALEILQDLVDIYVNHDPFYLYYNDAYWLLKLHDKIALLTYEETALPKPGQTHDTRMYFQRKNP